MSYKQGEFEGAKWSHRLGMKGFHLFEGILKCIPMKLLCRMARCLGGVCWYVLSDRRRIVARNLRIVIDAQLKGDALDAVTKENFKRTFANLLASAKTATFKPEELKKYVTMEGYEGFERPSKEGRGCVCCVTHSGNWEILARIRVFYPQVKLYGSMYRPIDNPIMDKFIYDRRTESGTQMFRKEDGVKAPLLFVKKGGMMGVLCDQFLQQGLFLPYFGKVTGTTSLPALLSRRTNSDSLAVCVRTDSLGHWVSDMGTHIDYTGVDDSIIGHTLAINRQIETLLNKSILDGFWMHHRWKITQDFAPENPKVSALLESIQGELKPFRIIVVMPEVLDKALFTLPMIRAFKSARIDMQISVACPADQTDYWQNQEEVSYVLPYKNSQELANELENETFYADGPLDMAIMLDDSTVAYQALKKYRPICFGGFVSHPMAKKAKFRVKFNPLHEGAPQHIIESFMGIAREFQLNTQRAELYPSRSQGGDKILISPISSLGTIEHWDDEKWKNLIQLMPNEDIELIGCKKDKEQIEALAKQWNLNCFVGSLDEISQYLQKAKVLFAVDGVLPILAGNRGIPTVTVYSSRLPKVWRPLGAYHRAVYHHSNCFPCYRSQCDQKDKCSQSVSEYDLLAAYRDLVVRSQ